MTNNQKITLNIAANLVTFAITIIISLFITPIIVETLGSEAYGFVGLEDCVFFHGLTDNPYKYMKNCDLFVLPSGWEGFPTVTVEAKVLGCPVLATDVAGVREQMTHGKTGWIVENDAQAICEGLRRLLDDPTLREKLRSSAGMSAVCSNEEKYRQLMTLCE